MADIDVTNDWQVFDWLQQCSYYSRQTETTYGNAIGCTMLKRENKKDFDLNDESMMTVNHNAIWELFRSSMSQGFIPKFGDKFEAAGISGTKTWYVQTCDYCDRTTRYRLVARQGDMNG